MGSRSGERLRTWKWVSRRVVRWAVCEGKVEGTSIMWLAQREKDEVA